MDSGYSIILKYDINQFYSRAALALREFSRQHATKEVWNSEPS
jgi:hypothetical protein